MRPSSVRLWRIVRAGAGSLIDLVLKFDHFLSNNKSQVISTAGSTNESSKRLAIFATYAGRQLDQSDLEVLHVLKERKYFVCLVSNSDLNEDFQMIDYVDHQIKRKNFGFDLAAYRDAVAFHGINWERILLLNDSILWPSGNFSEAISRLDDLVDSSKIAGLTDSFQRGYHLQSFCFLASGTNSINRLATVLQGVHNWRYKRSAVRFGELEITAKLLAAGSDVSALFPYEALLAKWLTQNNFRGDDLKIYKLIKDGVFLNSTQHFWRVLANEPGGFLKKSLIYKNPAGLSQDNIPTA